MAKTKSDCRDAERLTSSTSHLDRDTTTEGSSTGRVLASDHAHVALAGNGTRAGLVGRDSDTKGQVHLGLGIVAATGIAINVLGDLNRHPVGARASGVDHARVRTGSVTVDLVDGHHERTASGDLRKSRAVELHDFLGASLDVVGASAQGLAASVSSIASEARRVLLEGVAARSIARSVGVNCKRVSPSIIHTYHFEKGRERGQVRVVQVGVHTSNSGSLTACITDRLDDGAVACHKLASSQKADGQKRRLGEEHSEPAEGILNIEIDKTIRRRERKLITVEAGWEP